MNDFSLAVPMTALPLTLGRYRIAGTSRPLPGGRFAALLSIASGRGSASTGRLVRFDTAFPTPVAAERYAIEQGRDWVQAAGLRQTLPY